MPRKPLPACVTEKYVFATRLREAMKLRGVTQKTLADALDCRPQTVSLYAQGQSMPDVVKLAVIADTLDVSCDYLAGRTNDYHTKPTAADELGITGDAATKLKHGEKAAQLISHVLEHPKYNDLAEAFHHACNAYSALKGYVWRASGDPLQIHRDMAAANQLLHEHGIRLHVASPDGAYHMHMASANELVMNILEDIVSDYAETEIYVQEQLKKEHPDSECALPFDY